MSKNETPEEKAAREQTEGIASNIEKLANSVSALLRGPLNRRALEVLLTQSSKLKRPQVAAVLDALENLKKDFLK